MPVDAPDSDTEFVSVSASVSTPVPEDPASADTTIETVEDGDARDAKPAAAGATDDEMVAGMALYNLQRAHAVLESLESKPVWDAADTASFDCMHYLGDEALESAALSLGLPHHALSCAPDGGAAVQPAKVLDVGSGFGVTGRYLNRRYGAEVTGVELQAGIHAIAQTINYRSGLFPSARSVHRDFLEAHPQDDLGAPFDGAVSMLCVLHFPEAARAPLFSKLAACLAPATGRLYIEDMFALRKPLDERMRAHVACEYLPTREEYIAQLEAAGFGEIVFDEVSALWAEFVHARAEQYRAQEGVNEELLAFYNAVDGVFADKVVGGVRISAKLVGN